MSSGKSPPSVSWSPPPGQLTCDAASAVRKPAPYLSSFERFPVLKKFEPSSLPCSCGRLICSEMKLLCHTWLASRNARLSPPSGMSSKPPLTLEYMPVAKKLLVTICVSSTFQVVGLGPKLSWFQVVSCGRVGLALRPSLIFSLCQTKPVAELAVVTWAFSLVFQSLRVVLSLKSLIVNSSILGLA